MPYDYVSRFFDWATRNPSSNLVGCVLVSLQGWGGAEGQQKDAIAAFASRGPTSPGILRLAENRLSGTLTHFFSDRRNGEQPFRVDKTDLTGIEIRRDAATRSVTVELIARSWGDTRQTLRNLRVQDGVLLASGASVGGQTPSALYVISLGTVSAPV